MQRTLKVVVFLMGCVILAGCASGPTQGVKRSVVPNPTPAVGTKVPKAQPVAVKPSPAKPKKEKKRWIFW